MQPTWCGHLVEFEEAPNLADEQGDRHGHKLFMAQVFRVFNFDVIKKLRYFELMLNPDPSLEPDWDEDNIDHISRHGLRPEQIEEVYYGEGPYPTLAVKKKMNKGRKTQYRYRSWGTDASGTAIEAIIAPYPKYGVWRCVTAYPMIPTTQKLYFRRIKKK